MFDNVTRAHSIKKSSTWAALSFFAMALSLILYSFYLLATEFFQLRLGPYILAAVFPSSLMLGYLIFGSKLNLGWVDALRFSFVLLISASLLLVVL
ncbi:MAG TPA: hypothetical protein VND15_02005 [Candidatus Acidoferrales bacterium]|nr:hypothetical protein [Candidatus Acidoferrales bacterium]